MNEKGLDVGQAMREEMNFLGKMREPFIFILDFDLKKCFIRPAYDMHDQRMLFDINGFSNCHFFSDKVNHHLVLKKYPVSFDEYFLAFDAVQKHLSYGDSFLVNLTFSTRIDSNWSLMEIFFNSRARYKLYKEDEFVVFSPEIFVRIQNGVISSYPMKGTIDATEPFAREKILKDPKELAEHATIVDLIRNDLSRISKGVRVESFRYIEEIETNDKNLLQVSSKICGYLEENHCDHIGDIICAMLPAGSVTGAPKGKTLEIIKSIENYNRGYYTGVFGYFDGQNLDSGVMIRFIEKQGNELFFKSGGGVTVYSNARKEYQELIDKIYVPVSRIAENHGRIVVQC